VGQGGTTPSTSPCTTRHIAISQGAAGGGFFLFFIFLGFLGFSSSSSSSSSSVVWACIWVCTRAVLATQQISVAYSHQKRFPTEMTGL
jgi:hypothetical protein